MRKQKKTVDWGTINQPITKSAFNHLWKKALDYLHNREQFVSHLSVGFDPRYAIKVKVITELAWHQLFANNLFIQPGDASDQEMMHPWTLINVPGLATIPQEDHTVSDAAVMIDFTDRRVLVCGMLYGGEMKKAMFTVLNFMLTDRDVLPMHCAANVHKKTGGVALFFGLSGTGKTTLSADPDCHLIGDDEHGWSAEGVFNFEGGCYAKCIRLSKKTEPVIWEAIGEETVIENVVLDASGQPDFNDTSLTENIRAAYPLTHIPDRLEAGQAGHPDAVLFLTCDLYGVLPPVAMLDKEQVAYYFLSGYTALVGSTQVCSTAEIQSTFSTCFGAPFFPRPPVVYAKLLMKRVQETGASVYLVNTGWKGGGYYTGGERFTIETTRAVVHAILRGHVKQAPKVRLPGFNLALPTALPGVQSELLNPSSLWKDKALYHKESLALRQQFIDNFKQFDVPDAISAAGPDLS